MHNDVYPNNKDNFLPFKTLQQTTTEKQTVPPQHLDDQPQGQLASV